MKKRLSRFNYRFLVRELKSQKEKGIISKQQVDDIMTYYEEGLGLNFIKVLVTIGSILLGLGVLSFIASNWDYMSKLIKVITIIIALGVSMFSSYKLEKKYPKTSESLLYLSALIYGAGIFLMEQIFNYAGDYSRAFLLWTIGIIVISILFKNIILILFAHILALIYLNSNFNDNVIISSLLLITAFYAGNKYFSFNKIITFFTTVFSLNFILYLLDFVDVEPTYIALIFIVIGLGMYYIKHDLNLDVVKLIGILLIGVSGFILTFEGTWSQLAYIDRPDVVAVTVGISLIVYLLSLVRKRQITPLIFTCILILRYYFDTLYDFMPKSLFFIIGGLILLGFGYYIERFRKHPGGEIDA
ncbi:DUF2157 domain-containing protein [Mycoplasmatota bacterium zrk1]